MHADNLTEEQPPLAPEPSPSAQRALAPSMSLTERQRLQRLLNERIANYRCHGMEAEMTDRPSMRCRFCLEEVTFERKSVVELHLKSAKHIRNRKRTEEAHTRQATLLQFSRMVPAGEGGVELSQAYNAWRLHVVEFLLANGFCLKDADKLRPLLAEAAESGKYSLTESSHLSRTYIPIIEEKLRRQIIETVGRRHFSVIFDGETRPGEVLAIVLRVILNNEVRLSILTD